MNRRFPHVRLLVPLLILVFMGCDGITGVLNQKATVTLRAVNSTALFSSGDKMILCIHDEHDDTINYSIYSTDRSVTFRDVDPGRYIAHFGSNAPMSERAIRVDIAAREHMTVIFEAYVMTYVYIGGIAYPKYAMKAYVQ